MINRMYDNFIYLFMQAAYVTMRKQNVDLTRDNYAIFFKKTLTNIIFNNNYRNITSSNNARETIINFFKEIDFLDVVHYKIGDKAFSELVSSFSNGGSINYIEFTKCIEYFVDNGLVNNLPLDLLSKDGYSIDNKQVEEKISDVKYYPPSNKCREAILSGSQIRVRRSEEKIAGMQAVSDVGKVRKNQEDSYYIGQHPQNKDFKIMLVADGMGGCELGEMASNLAAREMLTWFEYLDANMYYQSDNSKLEQMVKEVLNKINNDIVNKYPGAGTTLCFSIVKNDNIYMCNIGDSKGFVMKDGKFIYETKTHNIAEMYYKVPLDFVRFHPKSNVVVYSLGLDRINVGACVYSDTIPMDRNSEYQVTLCSDGVTDCLSRKQIWEIASKSDNVARDLVYASLDSKSSFKQELEKSKRKFGIIGRQSFRVLVDYLKNRDMGIDYENVIIGGKDNTTAVSGTFRR